MCVPSWRRNSGAESVEVLSYVDPTHSEPREQWQNTLIIRARAWVDAVRRAVDTEVPVILMDVDCLVVDSIAGGFNGIHPFGVARWPTINIGVLFVDVRRSFPFENFFEDFAACLEAVPREQWDITTDQEIMQAMLHVHEPCVNKLPADKWNLTFGIRDDRQRIQLHPNGKIIHLHWHSFRSIGINNVRRRLEPLFPEAFPK